MRPPVLLSQSGAHIGAPLHLEATIYIKFVGADRCVRPRSDPNWTHTDAPYIWKQPTFWNK